MKRTPCNDRIIAALKYRAKHPQQLADELFVTRANRPDYLYSSVAFPPKRTVEDDSPRARQVRGLVGDWNAALPVRRV